MRGFQEEVRKALEAKQGDCSGWHKAGGSDKQPCSFLMITSFILASETRSHGFP